MCGFIGFFEKKMSLEKRIETGNLMTESLSHRGPDGKGVWNDKSGILLGHRRLSIQDLTIRGSQPLHSPSGRYVLTYNGEVYNFITLRKELENLGYKFNSMADTEVLLLAIEEWGLQHALEKITGMFAFGLWDRKKRQLSLARDRMGEKPIYYGYTKNGFVFASDLKPIKLFDPQLELSQSSLSLYFQYGYIPSPESIYQGIFKLPASHFLTLDEDSLMRKTKPIPRQFWKLNNFKAQPSFSNKNIDVIKSELKSLLINSVRDQMISDAPVGLWLSGGIDSALIASITQSLSTKPIPSFTIGIGGNDFFNEAPHAKKIAQHLGTNHTEHCITPQECLKFIEKFPNIYSEPFSDPSQIPTAILSQLSSSKMKVCLTGDGGDELFLGYERYHKTLKFWNFIKQLPIKLRKTLTYTLKALPSTITAKVINNFSDSTDSQNRLYYQLCKAAESSNEKKISEFYHNIISRYQAHHHPQLKSCHDTKTHFLPTDCDGIDDIKCLSYIDMMSYLPDNILTKVDRASMQFGLECRAPLLNHNIVKFAQQIPTPMLFDRFEDKKILRLILRDFLPEKLISKQKKGFTLPIEDWLKNEFRELCLDFFSESYLKKQGLLNPKLISNQYKELLDNKGNWSYHLWSVLCFQLWFRSNR